MYANSNFEETRVYLRESTYSLDKEFREPENRSTANWSEACSRRCETLAGTETVSVHSPCQGPAVALPQGRVSTFKVDL